MSRKRTIKRHLESVPSDGATERPSPVGFPVTIEIPTGGRFDVDGLIRELCRHAYRSNLRGFEARLDGQRMRCLAVVQPMTDCTAEEIAKRLNGILGALVQVGVLQLKPKAAPEAPPEKTEAECPQPSSQES